MCSCTSGFRLTSNSRACQGIFNESGICTVEIFVQSSTQVEQQIAVVNSVQSVFPSLFVTDITLPTDATTDEPTDSNTTQIFSTVRKEPVLFITYTTLAKEFSKVESDTGYVQFVEAVTEITEAYQESCSGAKPRLSEVPALARQFATLPPTAVQELRSIFGKMLCIRQLYSNETSRRKRQGGLGITCPPGGILDPNISNFDEFFACLDDIGTRLPSVFGFTIVHPNYPCLAFVVDTTGSMQREIEAVKTLIKTFISSERQEPGCYAITPFNDMIGYADGEPQLGRDYGPASVYDTGEVGDLQDMLSDIRDLSARGGRGDCVEFGMHGIRETLRAPHPYFGGIALHNFSQIIVITDEGAKDSELTNEVMQLALKRKVCIHLLLSTHLYCDVDYGSYMNISRGTGGTMVEASPEQIEELIGVFGQFRSQTFNPDTNCANYYHNRTKRSVSERCQSFRVSMFTNTLKFLITTQQSQSQATATSPGGEVTEVSIISGYGTQTIVHPEVGQWLVCVECGTLTISFNNQVLLDYVVSFIKEDEQSSTRVTNVPPGCSIGKVAVLTTRASDISSASLNFISDGNIIGSATLTPCGGAMVGNATFPLGSVTYQLQGEDSGGNPFVHNSRRIREFKPGNYLLTPSNTNPQEIRPGGPVTLTFELHNQNQIARATFTITASAPSRFNVVPQETRVTLAAGSSTQLDALVTAGSIPQGSTHQITLHATDGCTTVSASQTLTIATPPTSATNECGCTSHGTCIVSIRRGRRFLSCLCDSGYGGRFCDEEY